VFLETEKHTPYSCSQQWLNRFEWVTNIVEEGTEKGGIAGIIVNKYTTCLKKTSSLEVSEAFIIDDKKVSGSKGVSYLVLKTI